MDEPRVRALPSAELPVGSGHRRVRVGEGSVLVARVPGGGLVAFAATCPHQATDLGDACLADGRVRCPRHLYEYDLETGENVVPARTTDPAELWKVAPGYLRVFRVEERDGWIWVDDRPRPPPPSYDAANERPPGAGAAAAGWVGGAAVEVVRVSQGTTFELRLPTAPRPGFVWRVETGGPSLAVVGEQSQPGRPGTYLVRLAARAEGRTPVRCIYARPWDREPAEVRTYDVIVEP